MGSAFAVPLTYEIGPDGKYRQPDAVAREKVEWILKNYQPEPLEEHKRKELARILRAADEEIRGA
jgi:hypothetical protein